MNFLSVLYLTEPRNELTDNRFFDDVGISSVFSRNTARVMQRRISINEITARRLFFADFKQECFSSFQEKLIEFEYAK